MVELVECYYRTDVCMLWNGCDVASTARAFHGSKLTIPSFARISANQKLLFHGDVV